MRPIESFPLASKKGQKKLKKQTYRAQKANHILKGRHKEITLHSRGQKKFLRCRVMR